MKQYSSYFEEQHYILVSIIGNHDTLLEIRQFLASVDESKMSKCEFQILEFVYYQHEQKTVHFLIDGLRENLGKQWSYLNDKQIKRQIETLKVFFPNYKDY